MQCFISGGMVSNRVTRMMDLSVEASAVVVLDQELTEYPGKRKNELEAMSADLEAKYREAEAKAINNVKQQQQKLKSLRHKLMLEENDSKSLIQSLYESIDDLTNNNSALAAQIKSDGKAIAWMNVWRVIWGLLYTAGIIFVGAFIVIGFLFKIISFFIPKSDD